MGRRMVEGKTWKSYQVGQLTFRQRCLWIGLISVADDQGRGYAHPGMVRGDVFPYDDIGLDELQSDIDKLVDLGLIVVYQAPSGQPLYQIVNWWRYQKPTWAWPSDLPAPEGWSDREKYRQGNEVIETNWQGEGGFNNSQSDPTVRSLRGHDDPTPRSAPNGRDRGSTRDRDRGSTSAREDDDNNAFTIWERAVGPISPLQAEHLGDLIDEFEIHRCSLPPPSEGYEHTGDQWVQAAIKEAVRSSNSINVNYVQAILDRWKREGFNAPFKKRGSNGKRNRGRSAPTGAGEEGAPENLNTPTGDEVLRFQREMARADLAAGKEDSPYYEFLPEDERPPGWEP